MPLRVELIKDFEEDSGRAKWKLLNWFNYNSYLDNKKISVYVPVGFTTDFASVPRIPLVWLAAGGVGIKASIIHDFMYRNGFISVLGKHKLPTISRKEADRIFYKALRASKICLGRALLMYLGVRAFGWKAWNRYRKADGLVINN